MTELDFINIDPTAGFLDNINVFYSSSVVPGTSYADLTQGRVAFLGVSIPFRYINRNIDLQQTILQAETITFKYTNAGDINGNKNITAHIIERVRRSNYFFVRLQPVFLDKSQYVSNIPLGDGVNWTVYDTAADPQFRYIEFVQMPSEIIFNPYISTAFNNSPDNPILSNATVLRKANYIQQVDRNEDPIQPTNLAQILLNQATPAEIQDSNYTTAGIVNARYVGSKLTSGSVPGNDPALGLVGIRASLHPPGSNFLKIKDINLSDRAVQQIYFSPQVTNLVAGGKTRTYSGNKSFPTVGNLVYLEEGNRFIRVSNRDIYSIDENKMHSTNNLGSITATET